MSGAPRWSKPILVAVLTGVLLLVTIACAPQMLESPAATSVPAKAIFVTSGEDTRPTRALPLTPIPSPTTNLSVQLLTVAPFLTRTSVPTTPSPTLLPAFTSTRRPPATPSSGDGLSSLARPTGTRPPTRTPAPQGTFAGPVPGVESKFTIPTPEATVAPRIDTPGGAVDLSSVPWEDVIQNQDDVHIYRIDAIEARSTVIVSLSGDRPIQYKVDVIAPRRGKVGRQRIEGTVAVRAIAEVAEDTGTYLVYVRQVGKDLPKGSYFISAEMNPPPLPLPR